MDGPVDWWWKMSLLDVCVQAGFCQIRSQLTIQEGSRDPHNILECWKCAFFLKWAANALFSSYLWFSLMIVKLTSYMNGQISLSCGHFQLLSLQNVAK